MPKTLLRGEEVTIPRRAYTSCRLYRHSLCWRLCCVSQGWKAPGQKIDGKDGAPAGLSLCLCFSAPANSPSPSRPQATASGANGALSIGLFETGRAAQTSALRLFVSLFSVRLPGQPDSCHVLLPPSGLGLRNSGLEAMARRHGEYQAQRN